MPILGLTDNDTLDERSRLPLIARIYKGEPREKGKFPQDLNYFRVEFLPQYADMGRAFHKIYGNEPREFANIKLVRPNVQEAFPTWLEKWSGSTLDRRCDGEICHKHWDASKNQMDFTRIPCICNTEKGQPDPRKPGKNKRLCDYRGLLSFMIPEFHKVLAEQYPDVQNVFGTFLLTVKSPEDMREIGAVLTQAEKLMGDLTLVPFTLGRALKSISFTDDQGKRQKRDSWMLYINVNAQGASVLSLGNAVPAIAAHSETGELEPSSDEVIYDEHGESPEESHLDLPPDILSFMEYYGIDWSQVLDDEGGPEDIRSNIVRYLVDNGVAVVFESLEVVKGKKLAVYQPLIGKFHVLETDLTRFLNDDLKSVWTEPGIYPYSCVVKLQYTDRPYVLRFERIQ